MKITFGILAHVDAGKTTFSEEILYHTGVLKRPGRVDEQTSHLDTHPIERARGITIYSGQASFEAAGNTYYLVDTPGHVDFSAEMERVLAVLDYAVLVISGTDGVQSHTETVFGLLRQYGIPTFLFVNKMDRDTADKERVLADIRKRLTGKAVDLLGMSKEVLAEELAAADEELMERYLEGTAEEEEYLAGLRRLVKAGELMPVFFGSALYDKGMDEFLQAFFAIAVTEYEKEKDGAAQREQRTVGKENGSEENRKDSFSGRVFQIRHTEQKERMTFIKLLSGSLKVKECIGGEKINQIRIVSGDRLLPAAEIHAGDLAALMGPVSLLPGEGIGSLSNSVSYRMTPMLRARVNYDRAVPITQVLEAFRILEAEDPALAVDWEEQLKALHIGIMGKIQLEIVKELMQSRFGIEVSFAPPEVLYRETIVKEAVGCGHFEPLRHYAEVILRLEPGERGSGITFASECHVDVLPLGFQNLIRTHVFEKMHKGVMTGSPAADIRVVLVKGRHHLKHTEGGDFRESVYRAVRQGLMRAKEQGAVVLLEPWYEYTISVPQDAVGRLLTDITKRSGRFDAPETLGERVVVKGRGPVSEFADYAAELAAYTKGLASVSLLPSGYEECHNAEDVISARNYNPDGDTANPSCSVFCAKGISFVVNWDRAEEYMHCLK